MTAALTPEWMENQGMVLDMYHAPSDESVSFQLYLTEFSDNYVQNWESETSIGRNDPHVNFTATTRTLKVGLKIPTDSFEDSHKVFINLSKLAKMQYPSYGNATTNNAGYYVIKGSPIFRIKLLNWITDATVQFSPKSTAKESGLYAIMGGFSFNPDLEEGIYHNELGGEGTLGGIYPKTYILSFELTALHKHPLGYLDGTPRASNFPYGENGYPRKQVKSTTSNEQIKSAQIRKVLDSAFGKR